MTHRLARASLLCTLLVVAFLAFAAFRTADAQSAPVPNLSFSKSAVDSVPGGTVAYTLAVTNSGSADSNSQTIQDDLPAGFEWFLGESTMKCSLDTEDGAQVLHCGPFVVEQRHLNETASDFVNGLAFVTVYAEAQACGSWPNTALLRDDETGKVTSSTLAILDVTCPTPTPTPVTPTATPTSPPAATATPTFPATPAIIVVTATPTPFRIVPLPPNTGTGPGTDGVQDGAGITFYTVLLGLFGLGILTAAWSVWARRRPGGVPSSDGLKP